MEIEYSADLAMREFSSKNYATVYRLCRAPAEAGNADAQCMLALLYQLGLGLSQNIPAAIFWYERAAAQDHPIAWCNLGTIYDSGFLGVADEVKARQCYLRAHALGGPANAKYMND